MGCLFFQRGSLVFIGALTVMQKEWLSSRERVLRAIEHKPVDRVPIDLGVHFSTGISVAAYLRLREYLGLDCSKVEMIDCVQDLARVDQDIIERFHIDTVLLNPPWENPHLWEMNHKYPVYVPQSFQPVEMPDGGYRLELDGQKLLCLPAASFLTADGRIFTNCLSLKN